MAYDKNNLIKIFIILLYLKSEVLGVCPDMCQCFHDYDANLNKVICDNRNIINAKIETPRKTEFLDLSQNKLTVLDNESFQDLHSIIELQLYSNSIYTIYPDTFQLQIHLTIIDLSDNRLETIDERIFQNNNKLKTVNLSYNNFFSLSNKPFLISKSIERLNMKSCHINYFYERTFEELPNLKAFDLSNNLMITINVKIIQTFKTLDWIDLNGNPWNCDKNMEIVKRWLEKYYVDVYMKECPYQKVAMFEKMVEAPKIHISTESSTTTPLNTKESLEEWIDDVKTPTINLKKTQKIIPQWLEEECEFKSNRTMHICEKLTECRQSYAILTKEYFLLNKFSIRNETKLWLIFALGLSMGLIISIALMFAVQYCKGIGQKKKEYAETPPINEIDILSSTNNPDEFTIPIPVNRRRRRQRPPPTPPRKSFWASLFERRRVYHHFHPPTLIRRLSRSNLFNSTLRLNGATNRNGYSRQNSRRQQNSNNNNHTDEQCLINSATSSREFSLNERNPSNDTSTPTTRDINHDNIPVAELINQPLQQLQFENISTVMQNDINTTQNNDVVDEQILRNETPPPTYIDCVLIT